MLNECDIFIKKYKLKADFNQIPELVESFLLEMKKGLDGRDSSLRMIPTFIEAENEFEKDVPVLAIDAGGTHFRCSIINFRRDGEINIQGIRKYYMPGLEAEISSEEFFRSISGYIEPLAGMTGKIGFCFSYPTEILPDLDGILLQFCKEIQAPEVVGKQIGKNLLSSLRMPEKHIVLLNDTVATLLAGKSGTMGKEYDSYIGFILGTGTNTCYVERNSEITKMPGLDKEKSMIINIESGNFSKVSPGEIDEIYDKTTGNPGTYRFEKMISGAYFGGLCLTALEKAAEEGLFSPATIQNIYNIKELSTEDVNIFLTGQSGGKSNRIQKAISTKSDEVHFMKIINALVERAAVLVSANLAAVILKTGKGRSSDKPVMITIEGTTFYKLHGLKDKFENYFRQYLSGDKQRYYEFSEVPHSSLVGAGLAALIL